PILLLESFNLFNRDLMTPPVAKIIFVDQLHVFLPDNPIELCASIMLHLDSSVGVFRVGFSVVRLSNDELMQVIVFPSHHDLEHPVQAIQADVAWDDNAPPDRWFNPRQTNMQVIPG